MVLCNEAVLKYMDASTLFILDLDPPLPLFFRGGDRLWGSYEKNFQIFGVLELFYSLEEERRGKIIQNGGQ